MEGEIKCIKLTPFPCLCLGLWSELALRMMKDRRCAQTLTEMVNGRSLELMQGLLDLSSSSDEEEDGEDQESSSSSSGLSSTLMEGSPSSN
ncbi:GL26982 [Drosophila persimilis]|uniref:GL26982 n=1 Tax=Drosophila persimilis TaxID=7234 RepID=B4H7H4_DROPE|nr:GL26982 [Drosophila persimilis]